VARLRAERGDVDRLAVEPGSPEQAIADLDELERVRCERIARRRAPRLQIDELTRRRRVRNSHPNLLHAMARTYGKRLGPGRAARTISGARRMWPYLLMAWERWQSLSPEQRERYKRQARDYAERGRRVLDEQRRRRGGQA